MTRCISRASTVDRRRGFALISAIVLAILYIALINLLLIDSQRAYNEAQRFRARVYAQIHAENGVEMAAEDIRNDFYNKDSLTDWMGTAEWTMVRSVGGYEINATGTSAGIMKEKSTVRVQGGLGTETSYNLSIDYTMHSR